MPSCIDIADLVYNLLLPLRQLHHHDVSGNLYQGCPILNDCCLGIGIIHVTILLCFSAGRLLAKALH